jgi:hypothetical protein
MKRHLAFLLSLLLGAGSAFAQSGETINQLSPGAALQGTEQIPMYQGSNPAVTTTARALATYIPTQFNSIDATQVSGVDMCAKIAAAANAAAARWPNGAIIDARGFTGSQTCAGSMFANWPTSPFTSQLLLGNVDITVSVSQVVPLYTWVRGAGAYNNGNTGTSLNTSASFPINTPVLDLGSSNPAFSIQVDHIAIDCRLIAGCIGIRNIFSQEKTRVDHVDVHTCGVGLQVGATDGDANEYAMLTIDDNNGCTGTGFVCFQVGRSADSGTGTNHQMMEIKYVSCGAFYTIPANMVLLDGYHYAVRHVYLEQGTAGTGSTFNIGSQTAGGLTTDAVTLEDALCTDQTNCVTLASGVDGAITLINITGGSNTNLLNDTNANGCVIPRSQESQIGFYTRTNNPSVLTTSLQCQNIINKLVVKNMPTSCAGQPTGTLWNSSGTVHVC